MSSAHTSVPRWDQEDSGLDPTGRDVLVLAFGLRGAAVAEAWRDRAETDGVPVRYRRADSAGPLLDALGEELAAARVGFRLMLAGPEADVLRARATATAAGMLDSEITVFVTGDGIRRVWCSHCGVTTTAHAAVGDVVGCTGCGRSLLVYHHVSRRHATYLGFAVDAEEPS